MLVKPERRREKYRPRMRWMDGVGKDLRNLGVSRKQRHKNLSLEKIFRAGQVPQRVVVPMIIIK
jgi:hypothetical protein